jgi:drug/metabolite transporter (DMT)-like permease
LALAASSAAGATLQFFSGRSISRYLPPAVFGSLVHIVIWPITLALALWWGSGSFAIFRAGAVNSVGYAAVLGLGAVYVGAYFAQMSSLRNAPASVVAPFFNLEPVVTTLIAALALGERLSPNQYIGGGLVLAALAAASLPERRMLERR